MSYGTIILKNAFKNLAISKYGENHENNSL